MIIDNNCGNDISIMLIFNDKKIIIKIDLKIKFVNNINIFIIVVLFLK